MGSLVVNANGRIALPEDIVSHFGLCRGDKLVAEKLSGNRVELRVFRPTGKISDAFGCLKSKRKGGPLSIKKMNKIIADGWAGKR